MKPTQNNPENNSVHLDGVVNSCVISGDKDGVVTALMKICTVKIETDKNGDPITSKIYHRVKVNSGDKEFLKGIEADCAENIKNYNENKDNTKAKPVFVSVDGHITYDEKLGPHVSVNGDSIKRGDHLSITGNNSASIKGVIKGTSYTSTMAKIMVEVKDPNSRPVIIPVMVSKKDNPSIWETVAEQNIGKKATILSKGPLVCKKYGDDKQSKFILSVIGNTVKLDQKLKETTKKTTGPAL